MLKNLSLFFLHRILLQHTFFSRLHLFSCILLKVIVFFPPSGGSIIQSIMGLIFIFYLGWDCFGFPLRSVLFWSYLPGLLVQNECLQQTPAQLWGFVCPLWKQLFPVTGQHEHVPQYSLNLSVSLWLPTVLICRGLKTGN